LKDFIFTCASGESLRFIGEYASTVSLDKSDADPLLRQQLSHISGRIFSSYNITVKNIINNNLKPQVNLINKSQFSNVESNNYLVHLNLFSLKLVYH